MNTGTRNGSVWLKSTSILLLSALLLSACSGKLESGNGGKEAAAGNDPKASASVDESPLGKYDPPIEVSFVRDLSDVVENNVLGVLKDETIDNNRWTKLYEDQLGIKIKYNWIVKGSQTSDQYLQKINVTLASGDLPDVTPVNATQLKQLADSDQIEDMTALYEKYASPFTKKVLAGEGTSVFDAATFDGKLMAIPSLESSIERSMYIWIRTDWLEKLGLQPPKNMADVLAISEAFVEKDPDGNGKKDTMGLGITKDLWGGQWGWKASWPGTMLTRISGWMTAAASWSMAAFSLK